MQACTPSQDSDVGGGYLKQVLLLLEYTAFTFQRSFSKEYCISKVFHKLQFLPDDAGAHQDKDSFSAGFYILHKDQPRYVCCLLCNM